MIYIDLFIGFLKVGLFSFGGAYGAIPLIKDIVLSYHWLSEQELLNMIAISESTPGPIMVNLATYIGKSEAGLLGAIISTLAVVLPSFIMILLIMNVLKHTLKSKVVQSVLKSLKPSIIGIIMGTGILITLTQVWDLKTVIVACILIQCMFFIKKISPILLIIISAILGVLIL